jgi:uncharacterized protein (UPF0276 family)
MDAGIGLRLQHIAEVAATRPGVAWLEVHPENFLANPHACELLVDLSRQYPISVHTVGISIGSATGIDQVHVRRVRDLIDQVHPMLVSAHVAWSAFGSDYLNDLLPLPYHDASLEVLARHIDQVQQAFGRVILVENPSSYVGFTTSTMPETEFLNELADRAGCRLLCDVSNVYVSAHNMSPDGYDACEYLDQLSAEAVGELHLGGFTPEEDESRPGETLLIDTHAAAIADAVWSLYERAVRRFGGAPTIIEWDADIPPLATLVGEAARADAIARRVRPLEAEHAATR